MSAAQCDSLARSPNPQQVGIDFHPPYAPVEKSEATSYNRSLRIEDECAARRATPETVRLLASKRNQSREPPHEQSFRAPGSSRTSPRRPLSGIPSSDELIHSSIRF
jgi:hypothetical protein